MSICGGWTYNNGHQYIENKEPHYTVKWEDTAQYGGGGNALVECKHIPQSYKSTYQRQFSTQTRALPPPMQISTQLTAKNSTQLARRTQAILFEKNGYGGPIQAGEVVALKNLLKKLGKTDHIVYGWRVVTVKHPRYFGDVVRMKGPNYLFKSPIPGLGFKDFIMLARMYKDGKGLKDAVNALLTRIPAELKTEAETFRTIDVLAGLGEKVA